MQEAVRMQMQHWNLIGGGDFGLPYLSSVARFCEFNQRAGVAPQWYIGCRLMFVAGQLIAAVETEVQIPQLRRASAGRAGQEGGDGEGHRQGPTCWIPSTSWHSASAPSRQRCGGAGLFGIQDKVLKGAQARANACRPLNVSRLGSLTPAR